MLTIQMTIPRFENGFPLPDITGEEIGILLTDEKAVDMAIENVNWQADDTYFDAHFQLSINGELFYENTTTDAYGTWNQLLGATKNRGKHYVLFLDSALSDLDIIHQHDYTLQYVHVDYIWGDDNHLISRSKKTMTSVPLQKEVVEEAIRQGFQQFASFILDNDIPISPMYKEELQRHLEEM